MEKKTEKKSRVVLVPCPDYEKERVYEALKSGLELLGGLEKFMKPEEKILLKLNLVRDAAPERAVTTHPAVVEAFARILNEGGYADIAAGDSPGFGVGRKIMEHLGLMDCFETYGVRVADFDKAVHVDNPAGIHAKEFMIAEDVLNADALVSLSKMKTHALEHLTGAVKNQYGCVQGASKAIGHTKYPSAESMARMIVDLNLLVKPRLYIMDGIVAMEGNGPTSGDPVPMKVLLLSDDPVAVDSVFAHLVGADPTLVPTEIAGEQMGLGTWKESRIELLTPEGEISLSEAFRKYGKGDFRMIREKGRSTGIMGAMTRLKIFAPKPRINKDKCIRCGICVKSCPVEGKAVDFRKGKENPPVYDYSKCIRCFCCQEMCPNKAIYVR